MIQDVILHLKHNGDSIDGVRQIENIVIKYDMESGLCLSRLLEENATICVKTVHSTYFIPTSEISSLEFRNTDGTPIPEEWLPKKWMNKQ